MEVVKEERWPGGTRRRMPRHRLEGRGGTLLHFLEFVQKALKMLLEGSRKKKRIFLGAYIGGKLAKSIGNHLKQHKVA